MSSLRCILKVLVSCLYSCLLILGLALFWIMFVGECHLLLRDVLCSFCHMVEEILMHESFYSLKYKGCYLVFNFVA